MKNTLAHLLLKNIETYGLKKKSFFTKEDDEYNPFTFKDLICSMYDLIMYFRSKEISAGDKIALFSENRTEWVSVDFACMFNKAVSVPIYTSISENHLYYILENSESKICFVSGSFLAEKVLKLKKDLPLLKEVVVFNNIDRTKIALNDFVSYSDITGNEFNSDSVKKELYELSGNISDEDLLTIIYTSGTTGIPKGVMLTQKNIHSNVSACQKVLPITDKDRFLSYLPYSHVYERTAGYYLALFSGAEIYFAQNIDTISTQLQEVKPTIVITVPRLLDKIYNKLIKSGENISSPVKKFIFEKSMKYASAEVSKNSLKWKIADKLVYKTIRGKTGGELRFFVSGGGALSKHIGKFFDNIGIVTLEGYGLTESSPVISVNPPEKNKYGTVGKPVDGVEVKLSDENEILVKGDLVMKGYYKDEVSTNETVKNSWLYTGDIGLIDEDGYLSITDRKKSFFKTSGGKYVAPAQIEDLISSLNYIENVIVIGDGRMYVTALIVPDEKELINFAGQNKIRFNNYEDLLNDSMLHEIIQKDINEKQKELAHFERVRRFTLLSKPFTIESGELTPTLKIKRKIVEEKFSTEIESMYLKL